MSTIRLPKPLDNGNYVELNNVSSMVIVGANGSGKTRLGIWIEHSQGGRLVHRISAQRALKISDYVQPRPWEQADRMLITGTDKNSNRRDTSPRWNHDPFGHQLDDYDVLLAWIFAEHFKVANEFREKFKVEGGNQLQVVESRLEELHRIWNLVMPHRQLTFKDNKVEASGYKGEPFAAKQLSDGERVTLYLIAQGLAAPSGYIVVIDEPELHLHQAVQARLWDEIEKVRPDCLFVYITHDLGFAASRHLARKIWVKSYPENAKWDWNEIPPNEDFPESLVLQILGSRRPILFVEGDTSSLDAALYRHLFPNHLVIPRSSCTAVIDSTVAVNSLSLFNHVDAIGVIDRDHRNEAEIASYKSKRVFAPVVAEVENLFLIEEVIRLVSTHLERNADEDISNVKKFLFSELEKELTRQITDRAVFQVQQRLNSFPGLQKRPDGQGSFQDAVKQYLGSIDTAEIYADSERLFKEIIETRDYPRLICHYNRKNLPSRVSRNLGFADGEFPKLVLRLLSSEIGRGIRIAMLSYFPGLH
ncbi:MAG: AAA family ATPase [Planctomycetes bacterium]|nr:AAA family ATPase [Planctomycetota bacterium]